MTARLMLLAAVCLAPFATGCRAMPGLADDGSANRLVAAVRLAETRRGWSVDHPLAETHRLLAATE